ncbi:MAG: pitrilysin family protein [Myxococcales bacterium]|nr:insulinase family protein [Polyangiaceae bacterium]MDW8251835.1 pitrilysin family protein [Myxococcales bacterium]
MSLLHLLSVVLVLLLVACESTPAAVPPQAPQPSTPASSAPPSLLPPPAETPDAEFRKQAPTPGPPIVFKPPRIHEARLSNGIRVLLVEQRQLPIVALQVVATRGAAQGRPGIGSFTGAMLLAGTKKHSATELSDAWEGLGASHWASIDHDGGYVGVQVLSSKLSEALELLAEVIREPTFPKNELELERARRLTLLQQERDNPGRLLQRAVDETLYPPGHPYASSLLGNEAAVEKISTRDLANFHRAHFQPDRLTVVAAGDFSKDTLVDALERALGKLRGKAEKAREVQAPPPLKDAPNVLILDRPGASQSHVAVAQVGVSRATEDFEAILLMNTILGGQFSSRLNLNLREKHGYTYGVGSSFTMRQGPGPFAVHGAIVREHTADALREILAELERIRSQLVTEEELADAKAYLIRRIPSFFESANGIASTLASMAVYGLPLDEFTRRAERLERITREDVQRVAGKYLMPERFRVIVVGDAEAVRPSLDALKLGKIEVRKPAASKKKEPLGNKRK